MSIRQIKRRPAIAALLAVCVAQAGTVLRAADGETGQVSLLVIQQGNIPLVLSAPHGGREAIDGARERTGRGAKKFVTVRDENTAELALKLSSILEQRHQRKPYLVAARFERKYLDVNRAAESAYESDAAAPYYQAYHATLEKFCREVQKNWQQGLLLDIHGQASYVDSVVRGTNNGQTAALLVQRRGLDALIGPKSLFGYLDAAGYQALPKPGANDREISKFDGGYIVETYGSHRAGGLDAIQLEFGTNYRVPRARIEKTATDLADALESFARVYWPGLLSGTVQPGGKNAQPGAAASRSRGR